MLARIEIYFTTYNVTKKSAVWKMSFIIKKIAPIL